MRTMICRASAADKRPFRTVQCVKFATDERGATVPAVARYLRKGTRPLTAPHQGLAANDAAARSTKARTWRLDVAIPTKLLIA